MCSDLAKRQALLPVDPDEQKRIMLEEVEREIRRKIRLEDLDRIKYYLTEVITANIYSYIFFLIYLEKPLKFRE